MTLIPLEIDCRTLYLHCYDDEEGLQILQPLEELGVDEAYLQVWAEMKVNTCMIDHK